jgi:succinyl-CoA synthetase alpha subunit
MSILVNADTRLVVQGFTGKEGTFHAEQMIAYGTHVVGGVTPGKGGSTHLDRPVFDTVREAVEAGANTSCIFVPPAFAADAIVEAAEAGVEVIVCITEGIPVQDLIAAKPYVKSKGARLVGPNCPGLLTPGTHTKVGIMPTMIFNPGAVGVVSRSGTLTYECVDQLTREGLGQTTAIGIGGDPIIGTTFLDAIRLFNDDPETEAIVMIGEIGGSAEEEAAAWVKANVQKPVFGFIAGRTAPPGRRMGHAGAIVEGGAGTAEAKLEAMGAAGITVVESPAAIGETVKQHLAAVA